ncbi:FAD binding domain-containing protein [Aspergillus avenaceus]|uniref:FAD binding domain-containing protein n=1 Tax=Aspergillus avenaceus TaxID=36643 RepID=A0A5N6TK42_ASPAV|nr:FAD binding domain-containing protein [Aspergillus avenaceus]
MKPIVFLNWASAVLATLPLFDFERHQLQSSDLQHLSPSDAALFSYDINSTRRTNRTSNCKVFPGDSAWPRPRIWNLLDELSGRALIASTPRASSCYYGPTYNPEDCKNLTSQWTDSYFHMDDPIEMLSPVYQGLTCQPTTDPNATCTLGGYPAYAMNVSSVAHIQLAINFARQTGIRLIVKNTGHDFSGKSGGAGALSIWTHNLKNIHCTPTYDAPGTTWTGAAFKIGAGVQVHEIYKVADDHNLMVVGGEGQTVGIAGGYILGGGHSPLSSIHGLAADQVLSMEIVLPDSRFVTASFTQNPNLFWALRGGGGSTFGVVTSVTVKAFPTIPATTSTFTWSTGPSSNITHSNFWAAFRAYLDHFPSHVDAGIYSYFFIIPSNNEYTFLMQPFFAPNKTLNQTQTLLSPWFTRLHGLGIPVSPKTQYFPTFHKAWSASFPLEIVEKTHVATASRLFPRTNFENPSLLNDTFHAIKSSSEAGLTLIAFNMAPRSTEDNAVNPAWRKTVMHALSSVDWAPNATVQEISDARSKFTFGHMQRWRDVSPGAGSYLGEGDRVEPDFQQSFYGGHYARLLDLKRGLDPGDVFWAAAAVGSERWRVFSVDGLPSENGRLCWVG